MDISSKLKSEWYVVYQAQKHGPYTVTQIQEFVKAGKLHPGHSCKSDRMTETITIQELLNGYEEALTKPQTFAPPSRPKSIDEHYSTITGDESEDATIGLLATLQAAKERRKDQIKTQNELNGTADSLHISTPSKQVSPQIWFISGITGLLVVGIWIVQSLLSKTPTAKIDKTAIAPAGLNENAALQNGATLSASESQTAPPPPVPQTASALSKPKPTLFQPKAKAPEPIKPKEPDTRPDSRKDDDKDNRDEGHKDYPNGPPDDSDANKEGSKESRDGKDQPDSINDKNDPSHIEGDPKPPGN